MIEIVIDAQEVTQTLQNMEASARAIGSWRVGIGSDEPYLLPIETGVYASGRIAREEGPARMIQTAIDEEMPEILAKLPEVAGGGASLTISTLDDWARRVLDRARQLTPAVTGTLRNSMRLIKLS